MRDDKPREVSGNVYVLLLGGGVFWEEGGSWMLISYVDCIYLEQSNSLQHSRCLFIIDSGGRDTPSVHLCLHCTAQP